MNYHVILTKGNCGKIQFFFPKICKVTAINVALGLRYFPQFFVISRAVSTSGATYLVTMVCVCPVGWLFVSHRPPPPRNHRISKIPKPKFVSAHSEQLSWGDPPPPLKGKIFDTRFGLIHVQTGKKKFFKKIFFCKIF